MPGSQTELEAWFEFDGNPSTSLPKLSRNALGTPTGAVKAPEDATTPMAGAGRNAAGADMALTVATCTDETRGALATRRV
ncbi:Uncharacterised protein [Mycobacteroides abscessus subsp. abscessus]|nr:Uncharacterised protein [Mycobacteroides abscessus subsp. abscessus]